MGVANVIPGVSGGTIALITNIFERLIDAIKSFDLKAVKLIFAGKFRDFVKHTDLYFLMAVFAGIFIAILSIAQLFDYLFQNYPVYIWAYFFGLILASVFFVGRTVSKWKSSVIIFLLIGTVIAFVLSFLNPSRENDSFLYLIVCGIAAICSMILPGLSGSFVLILLGNYQLVMIDAVNQLRLDILLPVAIGAVGGLLIFSHILSWIFKRYRDQTIAILTGFILGSLSVLWPWKHSDFLLDDAGEFIMKDGEKIIIGYSNYLPEALSSEVLIAAGIMAIGILTIWLLEVLAGNRVSKEITA